MENIKKNLNAQTHVFGNFQFSLHKARNHLVVTKCIQIRDFVKFHVEELKGEAYFDLP